MDYELIYNISLILLFIGLLCLITGYLLGKRRQSHFILIIGWISFGLFWLLQIPHFLAIDDIFNATFCLLGFILFLYFTYHEILNIKWNEYLYSLNYIAGVTAVAGIVYYLVEKVEPLAKGLIYAVALKTMVILNLLGQNYGLGSFGRDPITNELGLPITGSGIAIILACTGIQSLAIFISILIITKSNRQLWVPWTKKFLKKGIPIEVKNSKLRTWLWNRKKVRARKVLKMTDKGRFIRVFIYTIPTIYVLNIFRNVLIIWGTEYEVLGSDTFNIAHNYLSKILSLVVLIILLFIVFDLLPEALEGIMGLLDLPKRTEPGMVKNGFIELDEPGAEKPEDASDEDKAKPKKKLKTKKRT